jgi:hypothetical protein
MIPRVGSDVALEPEDQRIHSANCWSTLKTKLNAKIDKKFDTLTNHFAGLADSLAKLIESQSGEDAGSSVKSNRASDDDTSVKNKYGTVKKPSTTKGIETKSHEYITDYFQRKNKRRAASSSKKGIESRSSQNVYDTVPSRSQASDAQPPDQTIRHIRSTRHPATSKSQLKPALSLSTVMVMDLVSVSALQAIRLASYCLRRPANVDRRTFTTIGSIST